MNSDQLSAEEKLAVAIQSHSFYHQQCVDIEKKINKKIDIIFQTEEAGVEPTKDDIASTVELLNKLLTLSNKFIGEASNIIKNSEEIRSEEGEPLLEMRKSLDSITKKQQRIHERVQEIREMLIEMYNIDEDDTF